MKKLSVTYIIAFAGVSAVFIAGGLVTTTILQACLKPFVDSNE